MEQRVRALRGAITLEQDSREQVIDQTARLVQEMLERNDVAHSDLISIVFTATDDIRSEFPAAAARQIGISDVPLLCARELGIEGSVALCIRVLMHFHTEKEAAELRHVYLNGAVPLRTDLPR